MANQSTKRQLSERMYHNRACGTGSKPQKEKHINTSSYCDSNEAARTVPQAENPTKSKQAPILVGTKCTLCPQAGH